MPTPLETLVTRLVALATVEEGTTARRLPPERELGEALGMSRGMLREQLAVLERLGFLHRTQGRGTYIDTPGDDFVRSYFAIARELGYLTDDQFAESRMLLEEALAEAAATRATPDDVAHLRVLVDRMVDATRAGDHEAAFEADVAFHRHLQAMVDNPVLHLMHEGLSHVLRETIRVRRLEAVAVEQPDDNGVLRTDSVHYPVVEAIEARDPEAARAAMRQHFENWIRVTVAGR
ncbi:FadR/GntR family transcriptional regulator [Agromyces aerolatus]|uniref:FadR/GntR family transcriptional regulator n=1 Tax=Agromyces sp. LY-1074 TaxID=3074080 RepID=UPI00286753C4|nr:MULTISPECIES: FCD domain-containing protein [unclassified Agromyces]MDR5699410.1 FCD domain-containing protein [Agromyces sp. LY-1074]MDR5705706.1 FCD domain-containing protein [Agromyces sp. LY-1358]